MATQDELNRIRRRIAKHQPRPVIVNAIAYLATHPAQLLCAALIFCASVLAPVNPSLDTVEFPLKDIAALAIATIAAMVVRYWTANCSEAELRLLGKVADEDPFVGPHVREWLTPSRLPSATEYHLVERYLTLRDGKPQSA